MKINNIIISEKKLARLTKVLPEDVLLEEYINAGLCDIEIGEKHGLTDRVVCTLRKIYGINTNKNYRLNRNALRFVPLNSYQKEFLHGSLFGDSCIAMQSSGTGYWLCRHSISQELLLLKKAEIMKPFTAKVFYGERSYVSGGELFQYIDARSYALPQFTEIRKRFYPEGTKVLNAELLSELTGIGLSFWWMDDGAAGDYGFTIVSYDNFFRSNKNLVRDIFKDVLNLVVSVTENSDGECHIRVLKESRDTAYEYIRDNVTRDLMYKLPKRYRSKDNQQPSFEGNFIEGSTTEGSLIPSFGDGDKTYSGRAIYQNMPSTCL